VIVSFVSLCILGIVSVVEWLTASHRVSVVASRVAFYKAETEGLVFRDFIFRPRRSRYNYLFQGFHSRVLFAICIFVIPKSKVRRKSDVGLTIIEFGFGLFSLLSSNVNAISRVAEIMSFQSRIMSR
jgi:hypothetical protein